MKKITLYSLTFFLCFNINAQHYYITKDGKEVRNIRIVNVSDHSNSQQFYVKTPKGAEKYYPDEIAEYHIANQKSYYSKTVNFETGEKQLFMERLIDGPINLYYYKGPNNPTFLVEKKDTIIQLSKKETFKEQIEAALTDCPEKVRETLYHVEYNKHSVKKFFKQYHNCRFSPPCNRQLGVLAGMDYSFSVNPSKLMFDDKITTLNIGFFIDEPINYSNFSIHGELYYSGIKFGNMKREEDIQKKYLLNIPDFQDKFENPIYTADEAVGIYNSYFNQHSLNMPLMLRYYLPIHKVRPYLNGGVMLSCNFKRFFVEENVYYLNKIYVNGRMQYAFLLGAGLEIRLSKDRLLFCEFRYTEQRDVSNKSFEHTKLSFVAAMNLNLKKTE